MVLKFDMQRIGQTISSLRRTHDMTQMQLADAMNVSYQAVSNWERGQSMPDISKLPELADLFGVTIDELLGRSAPLVRMAAQGQLEKHLKDAAVTAAEAAEAAPLLTPGQMDQIAGRLLEDEHALTVVSIDVGMLLPFMSTAKVDELLRSAAAHQQPITPYLPFASRKTLEELAEQLRNTDAVASLLPFLSTACVDHLAVQSGDITPYLPFMSTSLIDNIAAQSSDVSRFLPFMSTRAVDSLTLERLSKGEDIRPLLPFISSGLIDRIAHICTNRTLD